ncbi:MAG: formylglycine-generating enzyme family protein, partial [Phycisphaerales bacterium]
MTTFSAPRSVRFLPLLAAAAAALAAPLAAQNCLAGDYATSLGYGTADTVYAIRPIGFAFPLGGALYTDIHVNDHGFVQLSNGGVPAPLTSGSAALYTPTLANFQTGGPKIAPLYSDMTLQGGGECWLKSTATQCVVTWHNAQSYGVPSPRFTFQLILESNGAIRFVYGPGCTNNSTYGGSSVQAIVGVTTAGSAAAPAATNVSNGGTSPVVTTYEVFPTAGGFDLANATLTMVRAGAGYGFGATASSGNCAKVDRYGVGCDSLGLGLTGRSPVAYFNLPIPTTSALAGFVLSAQALAQSVANPGGLASSNGVRLELGFGAGPVAINPALGMTPILPGTFAMGSATGAPFEGPVRSVTLTRPFWMSKHEVTQAQFQAVAGFNPSFFQGAVLPDAANRPVETVKWSEAMSYCAALTASEAAAGRVPAGYQYRLPTEAEWEYCCRAGTTTPWYTGTSLSTSQANFNGVRS